MSGEPAAVLACKTAAGETEIRPSRLVALVGLPGVGKSTIGRRLASALGRVFVDTDAMIETDALQSISALFERVGETGFRQLEAQVLANIEERGQEAVIATGGGIVTCERSRKFLENRAVTVHLRAPRAVLVARVSRSNNRPLFKAGSHATKLDSLDAERSPLYAKVSRLTVDLDGKSLRTSVAALVSALAELGIHAS